MSSLFKTDWSPWAGVLIRFGIVVISNVGVHDIFCIDDAIYIFVVLKFKPIIVIACRDKNIF